MKIDVETIKENEDGSANCTIWMDKDAVEAIVRHSFIMLLEEYIERSKQYEVREEEK